MSLVSPLSQSNPLLQATKAVAASSSTSRIVKIVLVVLAGIALLGASVYHLVKTISFKPPKSPKTIPQPPAPKPAILEVKPTTPPPKPLVVAVNPITPPPAPSKPKALPAIEFGERAFTNFRTSKLKEVPRFTQYQINNILNGYGSLFDDKKNPFIKEPNNTSRALLKLTYANGLPNFPNKKQDIKDYLALILELINPASSTPLARRQAIAERLADAFAACQVVQDDTITNIGKELACKGNIIDQIGLFWQAYKMLKLEELVGERHTNCQDPKLPPQQQFPHIKNAYLNLLGDAFGLDGVDSAKSDKVMPPTGSILHGQSAQELKTLYRKKISLREFINEIVSDINQASPKVARLDKSLLFQWAKTNDNPTFGYYNPDEKDYTGQDKPTEEQEYFQQPYVSFGEIQFLLTTMGIA